MARSEIPEPVSSFIDAVNAQDEAAVLAAFGEDGVVDDWGREFTGPVAIKAWSDKEFLGATGTLTPEEITVEGTQVTVIGDWRSTHANGRSRFVFDTAGQSIVRMTIREG